MQKEFSSLLKAARKAAGYTQKELADLLGVATGTVQQWELGSRFPRAEMLKKIEYRLNIALVPRDIQKENEQRRERSFIAAWKAAEEKAGKQLTADEAMEFFKINIDDFQRLNAAIRKLNNEGRKVAIERIEELTLIDKFTLPDLEKYLSELPPDSDVDRYHAEMPLDKLLGD